MLEPSVSLTVFFEEPFWVGVFETQIDEEYGVSRIVFGAEPRDEEVYEVILRNFYKLQFTSAAAEETSKDKKINPKRMQKKIKQELESKGIGTKAQNAIKLQQEQKKLKRKESSKQRKEEDKERQFKLKQEKKKKKHKGH